MHTVDMLTSSTSGPPMIPPTAVVVLVFCDAFALTLLGLQSRFGDKPLYFRVICP